jgi:CRISPR-associated protein (TIGR02710 family)
MAAIQAYRLLDQDLAQLLRRYDYAAADQAVQRIARLPGQDTETRALLQRLAKVLVALDAWDRFDHRQAVDVLEGLGDRSLDQQLLFPLKRVIASRRWLDPQAEMENWPQMRGGHGFETVEDLLNNAERRAYQERFDDAVGRLYRAMELAAQLALKLGHQLETGAIDLEKLPESLRGRYALKQEQLGDTALKLGLRASYDLLAELRDPVGLCWTERRQKLLDALNTRNISLFAHGFRSIDYSAWMPFRNVLGGFLRDVVALQDSNHKCSDLPQLPSRLDQIIPSD